MKAIETQAPNPIIEDKINIFLAGSIEMGVAELWQEKIVQQLSDLEVQFLNPRRNDWDSTWEQKIENENFKQQVLWELSSLENSDIIIMYFDPNTKSPISLLELGLFAKSNRLVVLCPDGFWRKGNVDIVCDLFGIKQVNDFTELIQYIREKVNNFFPMSQTEHSITSQDFKSWLQSIDDDETELEDLHQEYLVEVKANKH
jgi:Nucleoside 2-deoxyribosyltransferase like